MIRTPSAFFRLDLDNELEAGNDSARYPVDDFLGQCDLFMHSYLEICLPHMSQYIAMGAHASWPVSGGYVILADDVVVMEETDELAFHSVNWPLALIALLQGSKQEHVFAWQGSNMTLTRKGKYLEIEDTNELGSACELSCFYFYDFVQAMLEATKTLVRFINEIREVIQVEIQKIDRTKDQLKVVCLERLAEQFSDCWATYVTEIESLLKT